RVRPAPGRARVAWAPAGGILPSVPEMAAWLPLQLDGGVVAAGDTLFRPAQTHQMWTVHTPLAVPASTRELYPSTHFRGYGLGWSLNDYKARKIVSHGGGYDGMFSRVMMVPEENLGIVVLTNSTTGISTAITNMIADEIGRAHV